MRVTSLAAASLLLAACAKEPVEVVQAPPPPDLTRDDCYTVVLFDDPQIVEPTAEVPAEYGAFLGDWTNGAWDGKWCHDVRISEVRPDGTVELYEMHAPYDDWGQPASAFKRTARIAEDGSLRYRYGTETVTYRLVDGTLHASRKGRFGNLEAVLIDPDTQPIQVAAATPAPAQAAPAAATAAAEAPVSLEALQTEAPFFELPVDVPDQPAVTPAAKKAADPA